MPGVRAEGILMPPSKDNHCDYVITGLGTGTLKMANGQVISGEDIPVGACCAKHMPDGKVRTCPKSRLQYEFSAHCWRVNEKRNKV